MSDAGSAIFNHDAIFADDGQTVFGAGNDLRIFHDHTNQQNKILSDSLPVILAGTSVSLNNGANDENMLVANQNGQVNLYYNNVLKLATASGGVSVTGELAASTLDISGNIDIDGIANLDVVDIDGAVNMAATITLGTNAYFIGANTTNAFTFNTTGDAANALLIKHDLRLGNPYVAKAHAHFSGTGTPSFWGNNSTNFDSITDQGTGLYRVNFTNNMANTNYTALANGQGGVNVNPDGWATTYVEITSRSNDGNNSQTDAGHMEVCVFTELVGV
jgi:hypothetical protein